MSFQLTPDLKLFDSILFFTVQKLLLSTVAVNARTDLDGAGPNMNVPMFFIFRSRLFLFISEVPAET